MKTAHPVVLHGCSTWDRERLPIDEFEERIRSVQYLMKSHGKSGLVVYGDTKDYAKLCYLTNYIPMLGWALVLIPLIGKPNLLINAAGTRDIPFTKLLTWVDEVHHAKDFKQIAQQFISQLSGGNTNQELNVGLCGGDFMRSLLYKDIIDELHPFAVQSFDKPLEDLMMLKRTRELAIIRKACDILSTAVKGMVRKHAEGSGNLSAVVEAERISRNLGAHDVRLLFSIDKGRTLQPLGHLSDIRDDPMVAYIAIEYLGYWAEMMVTLTLNQPSILHQKAFEVLQLLQNTIKPGTRIKDIVHLAEKSIKPYTLHPVTNQGFGHGIGLSLDENPIIHSTMGDHVIEEGTVYSLQVGLTDESEQHVLLSSMIAVCSKGNEILLATKSVLL